MKTTSGEQVAHLIFQKLFKLSIWGLGTKEFVIAYISKTVSATDFQTKSSFEAPIL